MKKSWTSLEPALHAGDYVFCKVQEPSSVDMKDMVMLFREEEAYTVILEKEQADRLGLAYSYTAAWITLTIHSALDAVGLTAAFSNALAEQGISCNVVAAFHHDHIFVDSKDADRAMSILKSL